MTKRYRGDEGDFEIIGERVGSVDLGPLFTQGAEPPVASVEPVRATRPWPSAPKPGAEDPGNDREWAIGRIKDSVLEPLLARAKVRRDRREAPGVTADDVHDLMEPLPFVALLGDGDKATSWIGPWLSSLARQGRLSPYRVEGVSVKRRSTRAKAHGNDHVVYLDPSDYRAGRVS